MFCGNLNETIEIPVEVESTNKFFLKMELYVYKRPQTIESP